MTTALFLYCARSFCAAAWVITHILLTWRVMRHPKLSTRDRKISVLPPLTVWYAFKSGQRALPVLWLSWVVAYGILFMATIQS